MTIDRQAFANEAEKALDHPLVASVIDELLSNLGVSRESDEFYGIAKVAMYVATVARAQALGIDPDELRMTADEADVALREHAEHLAALGVPVSVVADEDGLA